MRPRYLWAEFGFIFLLLPLLLGSYHIQRPVMYISLWVLSAYGALIMKRRSGFSWRAIWQGEGWPKTAQRVALLRFILATAVIGGGLALYFPEHFLSFPRERPAMWAYVMVAYPLLSVLPQEFIFRSFFFHRYAAIFKNDWILFAVNCLCFAYLHIVFHNWFAPALSGIGGMIFALSYQRHKSLKWVFIEHAAYGCMIFTAGVGWLFFYGMQR